MIHKYKLLFLSIIPTLILVAILVDQWNIARQPTVKPQTQQTILGSTSEAQTHFRDVSPIVNSTPVQLPTRTIGTATDVNTITFVDGSHDLTEGDSADFTWDISGLKNIIHTTAVYYGTTSSPGKLATDVPPQGTSYTDWLKDFMTGDYTIPLRFLGSVQSLHTGTYFYRAYALIGGKHYWSQEQTLVVHQAPYHQIHLIHYPTSIYVGANQAFTWDISGPNATLGYTAIVGGNQSRPGALDASVGLGMTPYAVIIADFTNGSYAVPLRFLGSVQAKNPGVYYFRALAFINGKNIWSDEFSFTVL